MGQAAGTAMLRNAAVPAAVVSNRRRPGRSDLPQPPGPHTRSDRRTLDTSGAYIEESMAGSVKNFAGP